MASSPVLTARDYASGRWVRVSLDGPEIASVEPADGDPETAEDDPWIAPALWDVQTNGRWGVSFADGAITAEQVRRIVLAQAEAGTARLCPTLITASREAMAHGLETIASACDDDPELDRRVLGIHLEGPWISPEDGYRGAHSREHVREPSWEEFESLQRASGSRIVLVTLAPERPGAIEMIGRLRAAGVVVAIGHSAAEGDTLDKAIAAGVTMSTHLGNGVPAVLPRHPNAIWSQAGRDELMASLIADGKHLDPATLGVLIRAKTPSRCLLVSDASPLAHAPVGLHGPWEVREDGAIVVPGTPYLAGSNLDLWRAIPGVMASGAMTLAQAIAAATAHPASVLGRSAPRLAQGEPADLLIFRMGEDGFDLAASCVGGDWCYRPADSETAP